MKPLRFAMLGAGFWAHYQLSAWQELEGVECVALCDPIQEKAENLAHRHHVSRVYTDPESLLAHERLDFVDIVTPPETHAALVTLLLAHRIPTICQKPMATSYADAEKLVAAAKSANVPFFIHENFRWQKPFRALKAALEQKRIGRPFRARLECITGYPTFVMQPALKELEQFILADLGSHILDMARCLFGEASSLYCQTARVHPDIRGEDAATVMLRMNSTMVMVHLAEAETPLENDPLFQTLVFIEGEKGSLELGLDYRVRETTAEGTFVKRFAPEARPWMHPDYLLVQSALIPCNADLLAGLQRRKSPETTAEDNLKTMQLVFSSYESARTDSVIHFAHTEKGKLT
ncbi:MAG TPA: Gfo/Idh/MocA family oxidoreductase [Chthonomonas sp.]|uniref:Gfo/Idh/MocA family protein n=1 Tax=Chthonomonas sp. TaxID=2282153 RepID=UPI002B4AFAA6|nr:Gfo/Idh/MocA family oxidoreductase [Chthonomonas sp.]HLI48497.1 Gfo/Idh/MocA family oxidoreductase [Chthonomonas sp.]